MVLPDQHLGRSEELYVNKSPGVTKEKQLIISEKTRSKLQIKVLLVYKLLEKSNMEGIKEFSHLQHQLVDRDEITKKMFIKINALNDEIENIFHESVTPSRVNWTKDEVFH